MRAIGYFRLEDDQASSEEFEQAFHRYCDLNLHQPVAVFGDGAEADGEAASQYDRMLDHMREAGTGFLVVVPNSRHLGLDLETVARSLVRLERAGAKVTCTDEEFPDPLQNAFQTLAVKGVSRARSERIKASMQARAIKGLVLGKPPFGYRNGPDGTLEVVKDEAAVVALMYRLYTKDGLGLRLIARELNERAILTRPGGRWNMVTIRDILRNPTYMGTYTRFGLRVSKSHEAIVPGDVFRQAQDRARARRPVGRVANAEPYLLSGLVYCGYCDNKMMGVTRRQSWRRRDGRRAKAVYRYYQCQSRNNQSVCGYHTWRSAVLEGTVLAQLRTLLHSGAAATGPEETEPRPPEAEGLWDARVRNAERRFLNAMRRAARGALGIGTMGKYLDELDSVRRRGSTPATAIDARETLESWDSLPIGERQLFLTEQIARVVVRDDSVEVVV